ncbi:hypothetical protein POL72_45745 [Sorangium sp. wiwo2]|uniref:Uncharacterized protein n=1 Tax=Sorangium atrum TaxID=2995308 RepID=A0ABT5CF84_9BACT|nr:hypothetical protein [Sorangium aterium]MDC0685104.1 hypothetical protein [Sorangium aterium]
MTLPRSTRASRASSSRTTSTSRPTLPGAGTARSARRSTRAVSAAARAPSAPAGAGAGACCATDTASVSSVPSRKPWAHACRWTLPLDVFGRVRGRSSSTACGCTSCSLATADRSASTTSGGGSPPRPSSSAATPSRSSPPTSIENAAQQPGRTRGCAASTVRSMSSGYRFRPRMTMRSLMRPVTNSSPPERKPRSPVRRYDASPSPWSRAPNARAVSSARPQYPPATLGPAIQISPICPSATRSPRSGDTTATRARGAPDDTSRRAPAAAGSTGSETPRASAPASTLTLAGCASRRPPEANSVASASP